MLNSSSGGDRSHTMESQIPEVCLSSGHLMPVVGMGTATYPWPAPDTVRKAVLDAIAVGYRHFDTAFIYDIERTEQSLGEAVAEALRQELVKRREELFITSKLWGNHTHYHRVLPALQRSLRNLQLDYLDLYLIHWPFSLKSEEPKFPIDTEDIIPIDLKSVWQAIEECQRLGLVRSIGVSNFTCKKLDQILSSATIPPSVNQVEMHPLWQQKKMIHYCEEKGIHFSAYSPLGGVGTIWGTDQVLQCNVLKDIAAATGKSVAQICMRWVYQQGASVVVKSFNQERMKENIDIFDWTLSKEELNMISQIQQSRGNTGEQFISPSGLFKLAEDLWDGEY